MRLGRKVSGGKYHRFRKKKFFEKKGRERIVTLKETRRKKIRTRSGNIRTVLLNADTANVIDPKTKKIQKAKIENVLETPQNPFLARENILTKGAIIKTSMGKAKITNRPSREGNVNAVLIE